MTHTTNDAPVTVEEAFERFIDIVIRFGRGPNIINDAIIEARHRLAALASAPAGDGDAPSTADVAEAIRIAREQADKVYGIRWMALEEISRFELFAAALARPRAAVGEREA